MGNRVSHRKVICGVILKTSHGGEIENGPECSAAAYLAQKFTWKAHNWRKHSLIMHTLPFCINSTPLGERGVG